MKLNPKCQGFKRNKHYLKSRVFKKVAKLKNLAVQQIPVASVRHQEH